MLKARNYMWDGTLGAFIEAVGDGCFRVRCECFNGSKAAQVISEKGSVRGRLLIFKKGTF